MSRHTRIVATIGPASQDEKTLRLLLQNGVDVARLNFSHGTHEVHAAVYNNLRSIARELGRPITILQDLQGPKIRTGQMTDNAVELVAGQSLTLTTKPVMGTAQRISIDYPFLAESAKVGNRILVDDGNLELLVTGVDKFSGDVTTEVMLNGILKPNKGVNLPGAVIRLPGLTPKDMVDLAFGLALGVDAVAVSFVRSVHDILALRDEMERRLQDRPADEQRPLVIAKLERAEALANLEAIVEASDGVMVARGDLGVEMAPDYVPIAQKQIIETANRQSKIVITATQMLESMITNPRPTRAEASDVANAIFDGTDAVMLSGETAVGKYPVQTVQMMASIAERAEGHLAEWGHWGGVTNSENCGDDTYYITQAAFSVAQDRNVAALAVFTITGRSARQVSKHRPQVPVLAFTPNELTYRQLNFYWGVQPYLVPTAHSMEEMLAVVNQALLSTPGMQPGQQVVITCGYPIGVSQVGNLVMLHTMETP